MRPLDRLSSIKLKLSILIVAAVAVSAAMSQIGFKNGWPIWLRPIVAGVVSLLMVQFLAHGMTSPLREMSRAADKMARGDYRQRVTASSQDEVGELARAFNSMAGDLAELDAERRALVSNAAHELRTPIAGLHATVENLADGVIPATPDALERLRTQTERIGRLVADLLDLSRLEASGSSARMQRVDIGATALAAVRAIEHDEPAVAIASHVDIELSVHGDPELLERLISNLLRNGIVHGEAQGLSVSVERDAHDVIIAVADAGPGFDPSDADHLFDRFYRGEDTRGAGRPGAGLGLAISRAIAAQHGGTIAVHSNSPSGCVVTVRLPRLSTTND